MKAITVLFCAALGAIAPPAGDCIGCSSVKTCEPHAREEARVLADESPKLRAKDPAVRIAALQALGELARSRENAPSVTIARKIATAADDSDREVRCTALAVLGDGQHAATALSTLSDAFERCSKTLASMEQKKAKPPPRNETQEEAAARIAKALGGAAAELERYSEVAVELECVFKALAARRDRNRRELALRSYGRLPHEQALVVAAASESLLTFGTRDVFEAVIEAFGDYGGDGMPITLKVKDKEVSVPSAGAVLHECLTAAVATQGLPEPAQPDDKRVRTMWQTWLRTHGDRLPAS